MNASDSGEVLELDAGPLVDELEFGDWIIFEDEDLLVLNKPGWLVCHPSKNGPLSSLVGAGKNYLGVESIHLVSRLDRETSGVVLLAKNKKAASHWQKGVELKSVRRSYLAILEGTLSQEETVSGFLGNDPNSEVFVKQRVVLNSRKAKSAETVFTPLLKGEGHTFCLVRTYTGRKHQIRVHAQHLGHPLVGEKLYGRDESIYLQFCKGGWQERWLDMIGMHRQALHGRYLHDFSSGEGFEAPLPSDLIDFILRNLKVGRRDLNEAVDRADQIFLQGNNRMEN